MNIVRRFSVTGLAALAIAGAGVVGTSQPAQAATPQDCGTLIATAAAGGPLGWGAATFFAVPCGAWLGNKNAAAICWESQQWWGWWARAKVWAITGGQYTRC